MIRATGLARSTFKSQGRVPYCLSFRSIDSFAVPPVYDCCLRKGAVSIGVGSARKPLKRGRHLKARLEFSPQKRGDQFLEQGAQRSLLGLGQRRYGSAGSARSAPLTREWRRKPLKSLKMDSAIRRFALARKGNRSDGLRPPQKAPADASPPTIAPSPAPPGQRARACGRGLALAPTSVFPPGRTAARRSAEKGQN